MKKNAQTALIHAPRRAPQYIQTVQPPLFRASTIIFENTDALFNRHWTDAYDYSYGTHGTPTTFTLGDHIAQIEGGLYHLLAPSGLSAINLVNSCLLSQGDEVWVPDNIYGPNMEHLRNLQQRYGIAVKVYNPLEVESFSPSDKAKLLWLEAAGSVTLEFPDLIGLVKKAQAHNILTALDNTWGAGLAFNAFDFGNEHLSVDMTVHALTKYPSGGGDILMGSVVTRDQHLHHQLFRMHAIQGICVSGDDVAQVQRSLASMQLRYEHQAKSTIELLNWLKLQPQFAQVLHPADATSAGHAYWKEICRDGHSAGLVSVIFDNNYKLQDIRNFCDSLKLFKLGFSWGGPVSLVMLYNLKEMRVLEHSHLKEGFLVRFCIGLEHPEDLIQDIQQALKVLA
ncbi:MULTISPECIES: PLP-dependent transferase [Acinetobacter]|uniref:PLP-dependent transferase n=2 Tax=Moraxellaceae TaxID=468 RepID=UPI0015D12571|nr:PLP-dependent transferase [Acinetobacter towneri]MCA4799149.1 PLP-dependent transferase [Acinetobacter towneri]MCO8059341.1 PLP-dependent transferase [Acinetobacter towneri]MCO8065153.1 PLP-dependent transferase [Acinetobacter towneri]